MAYFTNCALFIAAQLAIAPLTYAQVAPPSVTMAGRDNANPLPSSPAQGDFNTRAYRQLLDGNVSVTARDFEDSLDIATRERAAAWVTRFKQHPIDGMQLDFVGRLSVIANQDADARRAVAERLATPGLSAGDRIFTLMTAFTAFADAKHPERLPVAKEYVAKLDAMGETAAIPSYEVRRQLAWIYHRMGVGDSVLHYGGDALARLGRISFWARTFQMTPFLPMAEVLAFRTEGRAEIDRLSKMMQTMAMPDSALAARDPTSVNRGRYLRKYTVDPEVATAALLGRQVPIVKAQYWLNSPHKGYAEQSLADGKIRLVEIGNFGCPHCQEAMPMMKRLNDRFAADTNVQILYVTRTLGGWGSKSLSPAEEVAKLKEYYLDKRKYTYPIAIWAEERRLTAEGDSVVPPNPNDAAFGLEGTPRFCIVDGQGRLRHVVDGYAPKVERDLIDAVEAVVAEAKR